VQFERDHYLADESIETKIKLDNRNTSASIKKVIVKLVKTLECRGSNGQIFTHEVQIARKELSGIKAGQSTEGFEREASLIISDSALVFDQLRVQKERHFKPEDLKFASMIQPTTMGNCIECRYTLKVTRVFSGFDINFKDPEPSISINLTINPSEE